MHIQQTLFSQTRLFAVHCNFFNYLVGWTISFCDLYHTFQWCRAQPLPGPLRCPVQSLPCWAPVSWFPALSTTQNQRRSPLKSPGFGPKKNTRIYHPDRSSVLQDYKDRTQLVGDLQVKNCSLRIDPLHQSDTGPFHFRVEIKDYNMYSYADNAVYIDIKGKFEQLDFEI